MISIDEFLLFVNRTLASIVDAVANLDDDALNTVPTTANGSETNSIFQLANHATAAALWWTGHIICGDPVERDRPSEFTSAGTRAELLAMIAVRQNAVNDLRDRLAAATSLANEASTQTPLGAPWTVGAALMHTYEELAQHLGHIEVTIDNLA